MMKICVAALFACALCCIVHDEVGVMAAGAGPIVPDCNWVVSNGNMMRTRSCRSAYNAADFKFTNDVVPYDHALCSYKYPDEAVPVQCRDYYAASYSSYTIGISGDKILVEVTVSGYDDPSKTGFHVYSAPIVLGFNGSVMPALQRTSYYNTFLWGGIGIGTPYMDTKGRLVWSYAYMQDEDDQLTVVVPQGYQKSPYVWTVNSHIYYPKRYWFATKPNIVGDTVIFADCSTYPAYSATPRIYDMSTKKLLHSANTTVSFDASLEFLRVKLPNKVEMLLAASNSAYSQLIAFSLDLSTVVRKYSLPYYLSTFRMYAIDESLGIFYAWTYGLAGGVPATVLALDLVGGQLLWNVTSIPNDWDGQESIFVLPGRGLVTVSATISYSPVPSNKIQFFSYKDGSIMWSQSSVDFHWRGGLVALSYNRLAVPRLNSSPSGSRPFISILDGLTGNEVMKCPGLPDTSSGYNYAMSLSAVETADRWTVFLYSLVAYDQESGKRGPRIQAVKCQLPLP
jgi:hypothetical protein